MNGVDISVVIPVKNGERYLDGVLRAVFSQEIDATFEVIIIDSGSIDKSPEIMSKYPAKLYRIEESEFNHGLTRNLGVSRAGGRYIVFLTQDALPYDNYWMKRLVDNLRKDESVAGAYSRQLPRKDASVIACLRAKRFFASGESRTESRIENLQNYNRLSPIEKYHFCNFDNVSSCIKKSVWEKLPFAKTDFGEDIEWSKKVIESGYKIVYEPDSLVYHSHEVSIIDWYKRNRINYKKLRFLFGITTVDSFYKVFAFFVAHTLRSFYYLCRDSEGIKAVLKNFYLIPLFSFSGILGQYRGIKDFNENTPGGS